jgi:hypothetical protein
VPFAPEDLLPHQRLGAGAPGAPSGFEVYGRDDLESAVPEDDRAAYMEAADAWVIHNGGHCLVAAGCYLLPAGTFKRF